MDCMDRFDAYIRLRICIQVLACNVLVHYGVSSAQCMDSVQVDALCHMELAGNTMELATHLEFHIAIVLAMVAEWENVGVFIVQTDVWPMPPREVY